MGEDFGFNNLTRNDEHFDSDYNLSRKIDSSDIHVLNICKFIIKKNNWDINDTIEIKGYCGTFYLYFKQNLYEIVRMDKVKDKDEIIGIGVPPSNKFCYRKIDTSNQICIWNKNPPNIGYFGFLKEYENGCIYCNK